MKILIIEDELLIQRTLVRFLTKNGFQVEGTSSAQKAIEMISTEHYQKIFCDLMLQDLSGFDVLDTTQSKFGIDYVKNTFVIMTAYTSNQILNKAKFYQCPIITKPFDSFNILLDLINLDQMVHN